HLIVVDGSNVAIRHGDSLCGERGSNSSSSSSNNSNKKTFSTQGILAVLNYYQERGYKVRVFVPEYLLSYTSVSAARRQERAQLPVSQARLPDSVETLKQLQREGVLISTPPQDYDDCYCIKVS